MALPLVEHNSTHLDQKEETHRDDLGLLLSSSSTTEEDCKACQYQWSLGAEDWVEQLLGSSGSSTSEEYICRTKQTKYDAPTLLRLKNSPFAVATKRKDYARECRTKGYQNVVVASGTVGKFGLTHFQVTPRREKIVRPLDVTPPRVVKPIYTIPSQTKPPSTLSPSANKENQFPPNQNRERDYRVQSLAISSLSSRRRHSPLQLDISVSLHSPISLRAKSSPQSIPHPIGTPRTTKAPKELDDHRLTQRKKQISYGYLTAGYVRYTTIVPKHERKSGHPLTPKISQKCSKRCWDGQVRKWRRDLHEWDPPENERSFWESQIVGKEDAEDEDELRDVRRTISF